MALDDFMGDDDGSSTETIVKDTKTESSKSQSSSSSDSEWNEKDTTGDFYGKSYKQLEDGNIVPRGAVGYETSEDFESTKVEDLTTTEINPKFWFTVYPHILDGKQYNTGDRFQLKVFKDEEQGKVWRIRSQTCFGVIEQQLNMIPREVVMMDTNEISKEGALETLSERFGHTVEPTDTVSMHLFCDWMAMAAGTIATYDKSRVTKSELDILTKAYSWPMSVKGMVGYEEKGGWRNMLEW